MNESKIVIEPDGANFCAHRADWPGLPEGICGFGETEEQAKQELLLAEDEQ